MSTPTTTTNHLASLAAALHSGDRDTLARLFDELGEEALVVCDAAPTQQLWDFWLRLSETFQHEARIAREPVPPKPKRRWFR